MAKFCSFLWLSNITECVSVCVYTVSPLSKQYSFLSENIFSWLLPVDFDKQQLKEKVTLIITAVFIEVMGRVPCCT